jgi:hypothetical protein
MPFSAFACAVSFFLMKEQPTKLTMEAEKCEGEAIKDFFVRFS